MCVCVCVCVCVRAACVRVGGCAYVRAFVCVCVYVVRYGVVVVVVYKCM